MFGINDVIKKTDLLLDYFEVKDLIEKISNEDNDFEFESLESKVLNKIESSTLYLYEKKDKNNDEINFLKKYNKYISKLVEKDIKYAMNNDYCYNILYTMYDNDCSSDDIIDAFNSTLNSIFDKLNNELEKIENKILKGCELSSCEKNFFENNVLFVVNKELIEYSDNEIILKYFDKFQFDFDNYKNRQLYLIWIILKITAEFGKKICIIFDDSIEIEKNKYLTSGHIGKLPDGRRVIKINNTSIYNIKYNYDFYNLLFVVFHELGHLNQDVNFDKYSDNSKKIINMENELKNLNRDFYLENHDKFFIEKDASFYAAKKLLQEFPTEKDVLNIYRKKISKLLGGDTDKDFYKVEIEMYQTLKCKENSN